VLDKAAAKRAWQAAAATLAVRLRELREANGWGIEEAAEASGLHPKHLQRLEREKPAPSTSRTSR
jgi:transcriptional regulator with XRE-family HTH domain